MTEPIEAWTTRIHVGMWHGEREKSPRISLSIRSGQLQHQIVRARFTGYPDHPRALLSVLEGLALWSGAVLDVAISADAPISDSLGLGAFGGEQWPTESALVRFEWVSAEDQVRAETGIDHWHSAPCGQADTSDSDGGRGKG